MKKFFTFLLLLAITKSYSQSSVDSLFATLRNEDLEVSFIIRGICITGRKPIVPLNQDSLKAHTRYSMVSSFFPNDIWELAKIFSEQVIVKKLYSLLTDTSKNFYANALLYDLLKNSSLIHFYFNPCKDIWISSGKKKEDYALWDSTIKTMLLYN